MRGRICSQPSRLDNQAHANWQPCLALRSLEQYSLAQENGALPAASRLTRLLTRLAQTAPTKEIMIHV